MSQAKVIVTLLSLGMVNGQMNDDLRKTIIDDHNAVRRSIDVKNMPKMYYDMNLECMAKAWIAESGPTYSGHTPSGEFFTKYNACASKDDNSIAFNKMGENWAGYSVADSTNAWVDNEQGGCSERQIYEDKFGADMNAPANSKDCSSGVYGHFTNIARQDFIRVGCWYTSAYGTLCNYGGVNIPGASSRIEGTGGYNYGAKCSACPTDTECKNQLCVTLALETDDDDGAAGIVSSSLM
eukprot:Awhi_evm1s6715